MEVRVDGVVVAVEVYGPTNVFGFQLIARYVIRILKYLEIDRGYALSVKIGPSTEHDLYYAYMFETEKEIRPWLCQFAGATAAWLSNPSPQPVFQKEGPNGSGWRLSVEIEELCSDRCRREIVQNVATRSDDPRLYFEVGTAETTANGWWGRSVKKKMAGASSGRGA